MSNSKITPILLLPPIIVVPYNLPLLAWVSEPQGLIPFEALKLISFLYTFVCGLYSNNTPSSVAPPNSVKP